MNKNVLIYTDGACSNNPGPGGWGAVLLYKDYKKELSGFCENTTNNRMEILAVIMAVKALKESCELEIYTDSAYVVNAFNNGWLNNWQRNGWKTTAKKSVENIELWQELLDSLSHHSYRIIKVKGHSDNELNNRCDQLATQAVKKMQQTP